MDILQSQIKTLTPSNLHTKHYFLVAPSTISAKCWYTSNPSEQHINFLYCVVVPKSLQKKLFGEYKKITAYTPGSFGNKYGRLLRNIQPDVPIVLPKTCGATKSANYINIVQ